VHAPAFLLIIFPLSHIFLANICPVHGTHAALYVICPFSFEVVARGVIIHLSVAVLSVIFEITLKDTSTFEGDFSFTLFLAINPLALISCIID
jgi:hypothetical protein